MRKNKSQNTEKIGLRQNIANSVNISKEIILNVPKIILIGNTELSIENYKGVVEYTNEKIVLEARPYRIQISGSTLEVKSITEEMLYVSGDIRDLRYLKEV